MTKQTLYIIGGLVVVAFLLLGIKFAFSQDAYPEPICKMRDEVEEPLLATGWKKLVQLHVVEDTSLEVFTYPNNNSWLMFGVQEDEFCFIGAGQGYVIND